MPTPILQDSVSTFKLAKKAFKGLARTYVKEVEEFDIDELQRKHKGDIETLLDTVLSSLDCIKYDISLKMFMSKLADDDIETIVTDIHSVHKPLYQADNLQTEVDTWINTPS
jgi:GTP1/Obg family GTP-binding protein